MDLMSPSFLSLKLFFSWLKMMNYKYYKYFKIILNIYYKFTPDKTCPWQKYGWMEIWSVRILQSACISAENNVALGFLLQKDIFPRLARYISELRKPKGHICSIQSVHRNFLKKWSYQEKFYIRKFKQRRCWICGAVCAVFPRVVCRVQSRSSWARTKKIQLAHLGACLLNYFCTHIQRPVNYLYTQNF